jgi:choline dehydrogenase-like flavoprotein
MGSDPRASVVNADCRTHDVPNLYVVDGSVFPSASEKNPTHTIMALAVRTAGHIAERLRRGEL